MEIQIQEDKYSLEFSIKNNLPYLLGLFLLGVCVYVFFFPIRDNLSDFL